MAAPSHFPGPFRPDLPIDFAALREVFRRVEYTEDALTTALEQRNEQKVDMPVALYRTAEPTALNTLIRIFALHLSVEEEALRQAVAPFDMEKLVVAGLIERGAHGVRATARLLPWRDLLLLNDFLPAEGDPLPADFVMSGASSSSVSLASLTIRRRVRNVLDLGTGSGIHALLAAPHAERVVATDANPRALNFTAMNARLNGIENISVVEGSFFEPVHGERFDLIVSNPPFIIAPPAGLLFQGTGVGGDVVSERVVREAPAYLQEGGYAVSLISWHHDGSGDWPVRPRAWAADTGCDAWILRAVDEDPLTYAVNALRQTEPSRSPSYAAKLEAWLSYYRQQNFARLAIGAVILRKRSAPQNWIRCDAIPPAARAEASDQILRIFAAEDLLASLHNDDGLLDQGIFLHPDHVIEQELGMQLDGLEIKSAILGATRGIRFRATLDSRVLAFLMQCDGQRTLREAIAAMAKQFDMDFKTAVEGGLPIIRSMLRQGMLVSRQETVPSARAPRHGQNS